MRTRMLAAALAVLATVGAAGTAQAGPPGKWTQVTGMPAADLNTLRVGLARTADGVLHVGWMQAGAGTSASIMHSSVSANAKTVSAPNVIASYSGGANQSVALVRAPEGIRAFFAGLEPGSPLDRALATAVSSDGSSWTLQPTAASRGGDASKPVYAASGLDAAVGLDGTVFSAWGDSDPGGGGFHIGLDASAADGELPGGLQVDPGVGVDSQTGRVFAAFNDLDATNVAVMALSPLGQPVTLPNSGATQLQHKVGTTGRIGAPGVFVAYTQGSNEFTGDPALFRVDSARATRISTKTAEQISIAPAPAGRLWVFWKRGGSVFATRSNKAATKFGAIRRIKVPGGSSTSIFDLAGEGSQGPLDLLALIDPPAGGIADFHQRILPGLTLRPTKKANGKIAFKVTDAGGAIAGAKVKVKGVGTKTTGAGGSVSFTLFKGRHNARATKTGFAPAAVGVKVK